MSMNNRVASCICLTLGLIDVAVLNVILAPRLQLAAAATTIAAPVDEHVAREAPPPPPPPAVPALDTRAKVPEARPSARAMPDISFAFDSTGLDHLPSIHDLRRLARELEDHPDRQLLLRGHADALGNPRHNVTLSLRRASAVRDYLVLRGAPADRITVEGSGAAEPASPLEAIPIWSRDRRVELLWR
jgi:outer membrane protein OmpA-like peptidoglycan-associated protein